MRNWLILRSPPITSRFEKLRCQVIDTLSQGELCPSYARQSAVPLWLLRHNQTKVIISMSTEKKGNRHPHQALCCIVMSYVNLCLRLVCVNSMHAASPQVWCQDGHWRDQCYNIFRANGLCQRVRHVRPKTTNSNHNYYIYPDLLNVTPKFVGDTFGSMVVADITYVATCQGMGLPVSSYRCGQSGHSRICCAKHSKRKVL